MCHPPHVCDLRSMNKKVKALVVLRPVPVTILDLNAISDVISKMKELNLS